MICLLLPCFFSLKFLKICKSRTTFYLVWWDSTLGLDWGYMEESQSTGLAEDDESKLVWFACDQKFSYKWNLSFFQHISLNGLPAYLARLLHIISAFSSLLESSIKYMRKIFGKTSISNPLIRTSVCAYQVARNVSFS